MAQEGRPWDGPALEAAIADGYVGTGRMCVCGHRISLHIYDHGMEEFAGCQLCTTCPSHEAFYEKEEQ